MKSRRGRPDRMQLGDAHEQADPSQFGASGTINNIGSRRRFTVALRTAGAAMLQQR
jgi:hypothetical protein